MPELICDVCWALFKIWSVVFEVSYNSNELMMLHPLEDNQCNSENSITHSTEITVILPKLPMYLQFPLISAWGTDRQNGTCFGAESRPVCYLDKEGSLQCLSQVIVTAQQSELLHGGELSSEHVGFLQLLQLLPESTEWERQLTLTHMLSAKT